MATFDYTAPRDGFVKTLIDKFGALGTVKIRRPTTPSPTGTAVPVYDDYSAGMVSLDFEEVERPGEWKAGDRKLLVEASRLSESSVTEIGTKDTIVLNGTTLNVIGRLKNDPSASVPVNFELHCREL